MTKEFLHQLPSATDVDTAVFGEANTESDYPPNNHRGRVLSFLIEAIKSSKSVVFLGTVGCSGIVSCSTGRFRYSSHSSCTAAFPRTSQSG
ncbi:Uncharacterized protein HZ326_24186 [Fusarium oxysporum f. sp. albedinis]|nr:Uncharacterized protein HZ326_24186 [Fusarium oxysporum f. sp. albedinis]